MPPARQVRSGSHVFYSLRVAANQIVLGRKTQVIEDGIIKVKSAYSMDETIARVKQDIASKGIMFFMAVDQAKPPLTRALRCARRPCSCSATRCLARSSLRPTRSPDSTGR